MTEPSPITGMRKVLADDLKSAMRNKQEVEARVLRLLIAAVKNEEVASRTDNRKGVIGDEDVMVILRREIKQHEESIEEAFRGDRSDLIAIQQAEMAVLVKYLPTQFKDVQVAEIIDLIIQQMQRSGLAVSNKSRGAVIKEAMKVIKDGASGKTISTIVNQRLE